MKKIFIAAVLEPSQRVPTELFKNLLSKENAEDFCASANKVMSYIPHEVSYTPKWRVKDKKE